MADTSSIASRMEKLAELKRLKIERAAAKGQPESAPVQADSMAEIPLDTTSHIEAKALISASDEQNIPEPETPSVDVPVSETPALDESASETLTNDLPLLETPSADNATSAGLETVGPSVKVPNEITDTAYDHSVCEDDADKTATTAAEFETDDPFEVNDQDLGTELPADLLDVEEVSEKIENEEINTTDLDDEALSEDALNTNNLELSAPDENADVEQFNESTQEVETPDFAEAEIDPEVLEREFEHEAEQAAAVPTAIIANDGLITLTFDNSRSTLLNHVSHKMDCSPEDIVVTALDWYLDALFGEEKGEAQSA